MAPIEITQVHVTGRRVDAEIRIDAAFVPALSVYLRVSQVAGGLIQRYSSADGLIRAHTPQPHGMTGSRQIFIEGSQALEANGVWQTLHVTASEFSLKGSKFKGNISAGNAAWRLSPHESVKLLAVESSPTIFTVSFTANHPGTYNLFARLNPAAGPPMQSDPQSVVLS